MNLDFCFIGLPVSTRNRYRKMLALVLVAIIFLPTLTWTAAASTPLDSPIDYDHFVLYRGANGDTVCRAATPAEAQELDRIQPTDLRQINHLDRPIVKGGIGAEDLPQHLTIILRATQNLENNAPAKAAFTRAAAQWESRISSPVTIYIDADFGPTNFGAPWPQDVLGSTSSPSLGNVDYSFVRNMLLTTANTPAKQSVYNALPANSVPIDTGTGSTTLVSVSVSIGRAMGLLNVTAPQDDPAARIGFNSAEGPYDFDPSDGIAGTDFESVAMHEIGHALGFTSRSGITNSGTPTTLPAMWDLYRFRAGTTSGTFTTAQRIMTIGGPTLNSQFFFFPGEPDVALSDGGPDPPATGPFPNNSDGNQSSHWKQRVLNGGVYIGIMDPRIPPGVQRPITDTDLKALNIFGFNANTLGPPANDNFASAQAIFGCSGGLNGTNVRATREAGEINHLSTLDNGGGNRTVWYKYQAPTTGNVTIDTGGSNFDTVLGIYTGNSVSSLTVVGQHDDVSAGDKTSSITFAATAGTTYMIAVAGYNNAGAGGDVGNVTLNWNASGCVPSTVQFSAANYSVNENANFASVTVVRSGSTGGSGTVNFATRDFAGLTNCTVANGNASERCDYASNAGTLRFNGGETVKTIIIPIVNDALVEGNEQFSVFLSEPNGLTVLSPSATVTIVDNDAAPATQNPIDDIPFFVTQQYIDFLGRLPDATGFANWVATLNGCPNGGFGENDNPGCDRVHVSAGFFLSTEFQGRGYFAYRFYEVALDRRPLYAEFVPDMAIVGGDQSPESEVLSKAAYTDAWMQRPEFKSRYDALSNSAYVDALEANAEVTVSNKQTLVNALNNGEMNRGQVLRNIVESQVVADRFFNRAFVSMQYFGYLRRDPDTVGFQNWLNTLNADPNNFRHMIFGFLFSTEYRQRFGP
jgi:hypothetical protein